MVQIELGRALKSLAMGLAAALAVAATAQAGVIYESAAFTGVDTGEYIINDNSMFGAEFHLNGKTSITGVGAQFGGFPSGDIFAAIVPLSGAFPAGSSKDLASIAIAHTTFAVPGGLQDLITPLATTLGAGDYAVIFGTGQFGATGFAGLGWQNTPEGDSTLIRSFFADDWESFSDNGVRIVVDGAPVPEPADWALMIVGAGLAGVALRRRKASTLAA